MLIGTIPGIHHPGINLAGNQVWSTYTAMPDDNNVRCHCLQVFYRIQQCFPLYCTAGRCGDIYCISTESFCCYFKRTPGPGTWLIEEVDNCLATQCRNFFYRSTGYFLKRFRGIQNQGYILFMQPFNRQQIFPGKNPFFHTAQSTCRRAA